MAQRPENSTWKQKHSSIQIAVALFVLFVVYPLSIGPITWLDRSLLVSKPVMDVVFLLYFPLDWLYDHSELFRKLFDWYVKLWI